jgi:hypothetical protein
MLFVSAHKQQGAMPAAKKRKTRESNHFQRASMTEEKYFSV